MANARDSRLARIVTVIWIVLKVSSVRSLTVGRGLTLVPSSVPPIRSVLKTLSVRPAPTAGTQVLKRSLKKSNRVLQSQSSVCHTTLSLHS